MKKLLLLIFFTTILFTASPSAFAANEKRLVIGANLKNYKQPARKNCDIKVPSDYSTIQAGINAANNGNTICVDAGIYNEDITINKSITLAGNGNVHQSVVNAQNSDPELITAAITVYAKDVIVEGFVINGPGPNDRKSAVHIGQAFPNVTIQSNHLIAGNGGLAILVEGLQTDVLIQNNIIEGSNSPEVTHIGGEADPASKPSDNVDVLNNTFTGTVGSSGNRIVLANWATHCSIKNNVFNTTGTTIMSVIYNRESSTSVVNYNNINLTSITPYGKVSNWGLGELNAENNWWGDTDPSNDVGGNIDYIPFSTQPFAEYHNSY